MVLLRTTVAHVSWGGNEMVCIWQQLYSNHSFFFQLPTRTVVHVLNEPARSTPFRPDLCITLITDRRILRRIGDYGPAGVGTTVVAEFNLKGGLAGMRSQL